MSDEEVIAAYLAGDDCDTVGFKANIHAQTVRGILRAAGVELRPPMRGRRSPLVIDEEAVCRRYRAGESGTLLAQVFGTGTSRIYQILQRHNVPRRDFMGLLKSRQRRAPGDG
jgi:hypothetical protein